MRAGRSDGGDVSLLLLLLLLLLAAWPKGEAPGTAETRGEGG
jgi:hypothetical protein